MNLFDIAAGIGASAPQVFQNVNTLAGMQTEQDKLQLARQQADDARLESRDRLALLGKQVGLQEAEGLRQTETSRLGNIKTGLEIGVAQRNEQDAIERRKPKFKIGDVLKTFPTQTPGVLDYVTSVVKLVAPQSESDSGLFSHDSLEKAKAVVKDHDSHVAGLEMEDLARGEEEINKKILNINGVDSVKKRIDKRVEELSKLSQGTLSEAQIRDQAKLSVKAERDKEIEELGLEKEKIEARHNVLQVKHDSILKMEAAKTKEKTNNAEIFKNAAIEQSRGFEGPWTAAAMMIFKGEELRGGGKAGAGKMLTGEQLNFVRDTTAAKMASTTDKRVTMYYEMNKDDGGKELWAKQNGFWDAASEEVVDEVKLKNGKRMSLDTEYAKWKESPKVVTALRAGKMRKDDYDKYLKEYLSQPNFIKSLADPKEVAEYDTIINSLNAQLMNGVIPPGGGAPGQQRRRQPTEMETLFQPSTYVPEPGVPAGPGNIPPASSGDKEVKILDTESESSIRDFLSNPLVTSQNIEEIRGKLSGEDLKRYNAVEASMKLKTHKGGQGFIQDAINIAKHKQDLTKTLTGVGSPIHPSGKFSEEALMKRRAIIAENRKIKLMREGKTSEQADAQLRKEKFID